LSDRHSFGWQLSGSDARTLSGMNRRLKLTALAAGMALLTGGIVYAALPADAATADVQFSRIDYNPAGTDTRSNKSLIAEYVRLTNRSAFAVNLSKWTLKDAAGHKFTFPSHIIGAHKTVYVHTGKGANGYYPAGRRDSPHLYWNSGNYIWNNTGDIATLRSASGRIYDTCSWKSGGATTYCNFKAPGPLPVTVNPAMSPVKSLPAAVEPTKPPITEPTTIKTSEVGSIPPPVTMTPPNPLPGDQACGDDPVDCVPIGVG
jgi:hypothetical protein